MRLYLEYKKEKRTGLIPAFIGGGILAAIVPILNMAFRQEMYTNIAKSPLQILLEANWQMMAMLNILLVVAGACLMYHTEYADNAIQRMCTLPIKESTLFFSKFAVMGIMCLMMLLIEAAAIGFCSVHWFWRSENLALEMFKNFGYFYLLTLPASLLSLFIASTCRNMWNSLGIGAICVFSATMLPTNNFALSLFPFALPFQMPIGTPEDTILNFIIAGIIEIMMIAVSEIIFLKVRRSFE